MPFTSYQTTVVGWLIRQVTGHRALKYPDEIALPESEQNRYTKNPQVDDNGEKLSPKKQQQKKERLQQDQAQGQPGQQRRTDSRESEETRVQEGGADGGDSEEKGKDPNLVEWYGPDDPENPKNWSSPYKAFVAGQVSLLTFSVYVGSAIYTPALVGPNSVSTVFGVTQISALVGLTLFVAGYGISPMIFSPLSEVPRIGRSPVYLTTLILFVVLQFPLIYAKNIHTVLAMRFLTGFFGGPALAIGGASMGDLYEPKYAAYALGIWGVGAVAGPVLGPMLGGFTFSAHGWTWPIWVLVWLSGFCLIFLLIFLPETASENILYRRAVRLRKHTGNENLKSQGEIDLAQTKPSQMIKDVLTKPFILLFEPIVFVLNLYIALIYGLLYIWFESFPLVFQEVHGFNPGLGGTAFLGICIGTLIGLIAFFIYSKKVMEPEFDKNLREMGKEVIKPEKRLGPTTVAAFCIPICLFWFGWTGRTAAIHWIVPIIGSGFFGIGSFLLFQTIFAYLTDAYPADAASILAGNDLMRSAFGAGFPLFANAMYSKLGIGGASSLLGGLACLFIPIPFILLKYGTKIRSKSKRANHDFLE